MTQAGRTRVKIEPLLILYPRSENSITGIPIMNIYSDVIKSFLIHTANLFFATAKLLCGLLTTIHHHYKFISKKILRLLDNLRNAPVSTLNHDLSFVLYCQSKIRIKVQSNLALRNFLVTTKKFLKVKSSLFQTFNQSTI